MLAPREIPERFQQWNRSHHAPSGRAGLQRRIGRRLGLASFSRRGVRYLGPFAWQPNNDTRIFEYPWAYEQIPSTPQNIVDIGGGLAGLQFVLARDGHRVQNVDPGLAATGIGFALDGARHSQLGSWLGGQVELIPEPLQEAQLPDLSVDVVLSVSTIEHFSDPDLDGLAAELPRILKPTGRVILTIDLFLDLAPFTSRKENCWGRNIDIAALLDRSGLVVSTGDTTELFGFPDFDAKQIQSQLGDYLIGSHYPALTQSLVAVRRDDDSGR